MVTRHYQNALWPNSRMRVCFSGTSVSPQWRHNERNGVSNHQHHPCLLTRLFKVQIKENIKAPRHWPVCGEFTGDRWIPRTNGQESGKCFYLMTSSYFVVPVGGSRTVSDNRNQETVMSTNLEITSSEFLLLISDYSECPIRSRKLSWHFETLNCVKHTTHTTVIDCKRHWHLTKIRYR